MSRHDIDYNSIVRKASGGDLVSYLATALPEAWIGNYVKTTSGRTSIYQFVDHGFEYLFDIAHDRVIAAFGMSEKNSAKRDSSRMRGFLGGSISDLYDGRTDKGHIMSHRQGGGMDVNLFPQRPDVNRGRGAHKRYRALERYCAANSGTFCFSRLLYDDRSWIPEEIEYGIVPGTGALTVERFPNSAM
ncbi:hypothetical protein [Inquilinus sp. CAU 1745]|uniref:hypothetical protein n=1 Tax=Inquilinus sp. CAU 1745 TaxID=3140369 RepID=UPI00325A8193